MLRVLHLITSLRIGGAERQLVTLLRALDREQIDHRVAVLQSGGALESEIDELGLPLIHLQHRTRFAPRTLWRLCSILRTQRIDLAHAHMLLPANYARIAARLGPRCATVFTEHQRIEARSLRDRALERRLRSLTGLKIAVSEAQRRNILRLEGYGPNEVITVPNSVVTATYDTPADTRVTVRQELGIADDQLVIGNVANHIDQKRLDRLVRIFARVATREPQALLLLVGDGPEHQSLEELARNLGIENAVLFPGRRHDVPRLLSALDIFATTSQWEGMPINLLEAMSAALPSVNYDVGGISSVVDDGVESFLVEEDDEQTFAVRLEHLLRDPSTRRRLGEAARHRARTAHDASVNAARLTTIYHALVSTRASSKRSEAESPNPG